MLNKILLIPFLFLLVYAPFLTVKPIKNYYRHYEEIARKYECYPIETCRADFNGDGKPDIFKIVDEPNELYRHYFRLKIFVEENNRPKEILDIRYDSKDNTYRTHVAVAQIYERKELIIYDTINKEQFFCWNGEQLTPIWDGKTPSIDELAVNEQNIRYAMSLNDDTGGFNQKIALDLTLTFLFALYYFVLAAAVGLYLYFRKRKPEMV